jgi:multicomponent Na+:H+ antiporter subunit E
MSTADDHRRDRDDRQHADDQRHLGADDRQHAGADDRDGQQHRRDDRDGSGQIDDDRGGRDRTGAEHDDPGLVNDIVRRWPVVVALTVMWIALWGDVSAANVLAGLALGLVVLGIAQTVRPRPFHHVNVVPAARYLVTFLWLLVVASWNVVVAVIRPDTIRPGIIAMPLRDCSDAVVTLVANSISLTPGTLTLEVERRDERTAIVFVHALDLRDPDSVRDDILLLERRAVEAFAGPETRAEQARSLDEYERDRADGGTRT